MKKKGRIVALIITLVAVMSWFVYPRYKLYKFLKEYDNNDIFQNFCDATGWDFLNYFFTFYQYPESSEDSVFRLPFYEAFGHLPYKYVHGIFVRKDTFLINNNIENVNKLYLKGPNHNIKHTGQIINSYDYKNNLIIPVNMPFYKFLFTKGDILVGIIPEHNPCNYSFPQNFAYKEKLNVYDTIVGDAFRRAIFFPYREKYGASPVYIRDFYDDAAVICYEANLYSDTLILTQKCEPFNGEYDTSPMSMLLNKPLYRWAKEIGLHQFYFSIAVRPSFFEKIDKKVPSTATPPPVAGNTFPHPGW
jgi:hypothetical protein